MLWVSTLFTSFVGCRFGSRLPADSLGRWWCLGGAAGCCCCCFPRWMEAASVVWVHLAGVLVRCGGHGRSPNSRVCRLASPVSRLFVWLVEGERSRAGGDRTPRFGSQVDRAKAAGVMAGSSVPLFPPRIPFSGGHGWPTYGPATDGQNLCSYSSSLPGSLAGHHYGRGTRGFMRAGLPAA